MTAAYALAALSGIGKRLTYQAANRLTEQRAAAPAFLRLQAEAQLGHFLDTHWTLPMLGFFA